MERLGIECIFGMPGAHILPVYDSLYDSSIKTILAKHEQGASFMAGGYARSTGKIGACITTAGPGATNLVTGVANAYADKQPILFITGETSTHIFGKGGLQESSGEGGAIDQDTLFAGITRYHKVVERTDYLAQVLKQASKILLSSSSGPVLLSFPFNVQKEQVELDILDEIKTTRNSYSAPDNTEAITDIATLLCQAHKPVIIAGYGCIKAGAQEVLSQLSETMNIPVATSLKGKGAIAESSPLSLGSLGVTSYGLAYEYIIQNADLLMFLGASFNERTSYLWDKKLLANKKIVQIDNDYNQLEKVFKADIAIAADLKEALSSVLAQVHSDANKARLAEKLQKQINHLKQETIENDSSIFQSRFPLVEKFFAVLEKNFPEDAVIFDDNVIFAQNFFQVSSRNRYHPNSGVSSLGHAIPAAIGARFSENKPTFAVLGDGGFQMCCMEIMTAVNYNIPITIVLFNNATMGLIRKNQFQQYNERFISCDFINPDFELLCKSFGIHYARIEKATDLDKLFTKLDCHNAINLIEIPIDKNTFPNYMSKR